MTLAARSEAAMDARLWVVWLAACQAVLVACGGEPAASACAAQHRLRGGSCDIRDEDCQRSIFAAVRCVRGGRGSLPAVRVISVDDYARELEEADRERMAAAEDEPAAPTVDHWGAGLIMLGLMPAAVSAGAADRDNAVSNVAAYFSYEYADITIVDRGEPMDAPDTNKLLAHEYVHALQAEVDGLLEHQERTAGLTDVQHATRSLVEGEATLMEDLAYAALFNLPEAELHHAQHYEDRVLWSRSSALLAPAPFLEARWITYGVGAGYLWQVYQAAGMEGLRALWHRQPATMVQWMSGPDAEPGAADRWLQSFACRRPEAPGDDYELQFRDSLGALVLQLLLGVHDGDQRRQAAAAWDSALDWRGDRYLVFGSEAGATAVSWQVRMSSEDAAAHLEAALERLPASTVVTRDGVEVTLFAGEDPSLASDWRDAYRCAPEER